MSARKEVGLIIEHNVTKRTRVNHFSWDPCATSTPVRKPLNTLNNFEHGFGYNQCNVIPRNISFKTTPKKLEGPNLIGNSSKKISKKNKPKSRNNSFYCNQDDEESDDNQHDEACQKDKETRKNLIIKLGSDEFDNKKIKRTKIIEAVNKEVSQNSVIKEQNEIIKKKITCRSANNKNKIKANNSKVMVSAPCEKRKITKSKNRNDTGNIKTAKNAVSSDSSMNNIASNGKCLISELCEKDKEIVTDNVPLKRRNKIVPLNNVASKKSKSDPEVSGLNNMESDPVEKVKQIENNLHKGVKKGETKLSTSHEIFSENKEKELRDSFDLTAAAAAAATTTTSEELNDNPKSNYSPVFQVTKRKQKVVTKKKISVPKNKLKSKTILPKMEISDERPRRARKSPKEFWLPKSEDDNTNKDSIHEVVDIDKLKQVELPSPSIMQVEERASKKMMTFSEKGSSNSFIVKDFFNDIKEMQFTEVSSIGNEREVFSYALGWKFPAFKCGALKIGRNCESSGRTEHENSHFGGVLLQGKLLMKIRENEMELSSGQMFYVPPLTDWKAINTTRKDCILYYWTGRFQPKKNE